MSDGDGIKNNELVGHPINIDTVSPLQDVVKNHIDTISESHVRELLQALEKFETSILTKFDKTLAAQNPEGVGLLKIFQDEMATLRHVFYLSSQKVSDSIIQIGASLNNHNKLTIFTPWYDTLATYWVGVSITPLVVGVAAYIVGKKQNELIAKQNAIYDRQNDLYELDIAQRNYALKAGVYGEVRGLFNAAISNPGNVNVSGNEMSRLISETRFLFSEKIVGFVTEVCNRINSIMWSGRHISKLEDRVYSGTAMQQEHDLYHKSIDENQRDLEWFADNLNRVDELFVPEVRISSEKKP